MRGLQLVCYWTWVVSPENVIRLLAIDASYPYVPAIREAFTDVVRVAERLDVDLSNWLGSRAELIRVFG